MDYAQDTKYPTTLAVAKQKDIIVNAVLAGRRPRYERVWRDIAQSGNGRFIPIPQDGGQVVIIKRPTMTTSSSCRRKSNGTVIPYGPRALQKHTEDKARQLSQVAAAAPSQASEMASYLNKRARVSSEAVTGDGRSGQRRRGRTSAALPPSRTTNCRDNLRALKPEQRMDEPRQADEATQRLEPETLSAGCKARQVRRRAARRDAAEGVIVRSRRRGYV